MSVKLFWQLKQLPQCLLQQFLPGDKVLTLYGEEGTVQRKFTSGGYDWWVLIKFIAKGREFETLEPYQRSELVNLEKIPKNLLTKD